VNRTIARNVAWNWGGTLCDAAVSFVIAPFLVNTLGATSYGLWILIGSLTSYFGLLDLGIRGAVGRYIAYHRARSDQQGVNSTVSTAFGACCALGLIVIALLPLVEWLFFRTFDVPAADVGATRLALRVVIVNFGLTFPLSLFDGTLWAQQRYDLLNMVDIPATLLRAALSWWVVTRGFGLPGLAVLTLAVAVAVGVAKAVMTFRLDRQLRISYANVTRTAARTLYGYGAVNFVITVARMTRLQFTPLFVGWLMSPAAVTLYSIAKRLLDYTEKVFTSGTGVLMPMAAAQEATGDRDGQRAMFTRGGRIMVTLSMLFVGFFLCVGERLIVLWMGPRWTDAAVLLKILAVGEGIALTQALTGYMLLGAARHKAMAVFQTIEIVVIAVLALTLVPRYGLVGLCLALAAPGAILRGVAVLVYACRVIGVSVGSYMLRGVLPGALAAAGPVALLALAVAAHSPANWSQFLLYGGAYGVVSFAACCASLGVPFSRLLRRPGRVPVPAASAISAEGR
jgi:O-antigen/teichoic acid export membrane protein